VQDGIQLEFDKIEDDVRMHCDNRNRFIVTADEKLTAFLELERVTCESFRFQMPNDSAQLSHDSAFIGFSPGEQAD
jgi:hypothetical protein